MAAPTNMFAGVTSLMELMGRKEAMLSPENLYCDNEIPRTEGRSRAARIKADYEAQVKVINAL